MIHTEVMAVMLMVLNHMVVMVVMLMVLNHMVVMVERKRGEI